MTDVPALCLFLYESESEVIHLKTIRTIRGIVKELRALDIDCAVTENCIRQLCKSGAIPVRRSGNRYLVALEDVNQYFETVWSEETERG